MTPRPTFDTGFSTGAMTQIFSAASTVGAILEFESALAAALADVGVAPIEEISVLVDVCGNVVEDPEGVLASTWERGTPIPTLGARVTDGLPDAVGRWFHHGATTQDAIDTGLVLQARHGLVAVDEDLEALAKTLRELTLDYRDQPQMGRTFLQNARPTTFGLTTATWLSAVDDHRRALRQTRDHLPLQLGGSTGALSDYGDLGLELRSRVAGRLGLRATAVPWHGDRTPILTIAHGLDRVARTMAKIATDVALLASSEIGEISVRSGGSSSMPDKENPIDSIRAIAAAAACSGAVAMLSSAPPPELERGVGGWHVEWMALPVVFHTAGATVEAMRKCLQSLRVDDEAMASRIAATDRAGVIAGAGPQIDRLLAQTEGEEDS